MAQRMLRAVRAASKDDPLCNALTVLVTRDLMDAAMHPSEDFGFTPLTIQFATRVRELDRQLGIWDEEPALIRGVLDGAW